MRESVHVGDMVVRGIKEGKEDNSVKPYKGIVIYVHPKGRFHTVEFVVGPDTFKESFFGVRRDML